MPRFHYQALNADEQPVAGEIDAGSVQEAIAALSGEGLTVQSIALVSAEATPQPESKGMPPLRQPQTSRSASWEQSAIEQHLAALLPQARSLAPALRAYAEELGAGRRRTELLNVCQLLESDDVPQAASRLTSLPDYWIPLLSAAAAMNDPGRVLREFLEEAERTEQLRTQWRRTLAYPLAVAALALGVMLALGLLIVPSFEELFQDFGLQLPLFTRVVLDLSNFLTSGPTLVFLLVVAVIGLLLSLRRWALPGPIASWLDRWLTGRFRRSAARSRFSRFTADLLEAGMAPDAAVRIAADTTRAPRIREAALGLADDLRLHRPVDASVVAPLSRTVAYALSREIADDSRVRLLKEVSNCYLDRTRRQLSWARGVIGPVAICAVGFGVGAVVLALFLPLVTLIHNLSG
jgi:general secretion pathway protein F